MRKWRINSVDGCRVSCIVHVTVVPASRNILRVSALFAGVDHPPLLTYFSVESIFVTALKGAYLPAQGPCARFPLAGPETISASSNNIWGI